MSWPPRRPSVETPILQLYRLGGTIHGINSLLHDTVASAAKLAELSDGFDSGRLPRPPHVAVGWDDILPAYAKVARSSGEKYVVQPHR